MMGARISTRQIAAWLGPEDRLALLVGAATAFSVAGVRQGWLGALPCAVLGAAAVAIWLIDLRHYLIPDRLSLPLIPLGLIHAGLVAPLWPRIITVAGVWAALTLLQRAFLRLRGKHGLGGGDVKLMSAAAAWLPGEGLPFYLLAASLTALIVALARRANRNRPLAFGAHLAPWLVVFALFG